VVTASFSAHGAAVWNGTNICGKHTVEVYLKTLLSDAAMYRMRVAWTWHEHTNLLVWTYMHAVM